MEKRGTLRPCGWFFPGNVGFLLRSFRAPDFWGGTVIPGFRFASPGANNLHPAGVLRFPLVTPVLRCGGDPCRSCGIGGAAGGRKGVAPFQGFGLGDFISLGDAQGYGVERRRREEWCRCGGGGSWTKPGHD